MLHKQLHGVDHIDILKRDIEGAALEVLTHSGVAALLDPNHLDHSRHAVDVHSVATEFSTLDAACVALARVEALFLGRALGPLPDLTVGHAKQSPAIESISHILNRHGRLLDRLLRGFCPELLGPETERRTFLGRGPLSLQLPFQAGDMFGRVFSIPGATIGNCIARIRGRVRQYGKQKNAVSKGPASQSVRSHVLCWTDRDTFTMHEQQAFLATWPIARQQPNSCRKL